MLPGARNLTILFLLLAGLSGLTLNTAHAAFTNKASLLKTGLTDVQTVGNYTYGVIWNSMVIFDVSDPAAPVLVSELDLDGRLNAIEVSGNHAFIASGLVGMYVVDISSPSAPVLVSTVQIPWKSQGSIVDVSIEGSYAVLSRESYGIVIVDISNPSAPAAVGILNVTGAEYVRRTRIAGGYIYIADNILGIRVVDMSNPSSPQEVFRQALPAGVAMDVYPQDGGLYVAADSGGLAIYDISNPAAPVLLSQIALGGTGEAWELRALGNYAYVVDKVVGLFIVDVSDRLNPFIAGLYDTPDWDYRVDVVGDLVYVAGGWTGSFLIIDAGVPSSPGLLGTYDFNGEVHGLFVRGDYAYQASGKTGFFVIDISSPDTPAIAGFLPIIGAGFDIEIPQGTDTAYIADGAGLVIVDVTDPYNPAMMNSIPLQGIVRAVKVRNSLAYIVSGPKGLIILDVSDPLNPQHVATIGVPGFANNIVLSGTHAYIAARDGGLHVVDVSNPYSPVLTGTFTAPEGEVWDVIVSGDIAYISTKTNVTVLDVSNPYNPVQIGQSEKFNYSMKALQLYNTYLFVGNFASGFFILDVSNPSNPVYVRWVKTSGYPYVPEGIQIQYPYIYVSDLGAFTVIKYEGLIR